MGEGERRGAAKVALLGGLLMLAGLPLPWIASGVGPEQTPAHGFDLVAVWMPTVLAALTVLVLAGIWLGSGSDRFAIYVALGAGFLVLFGGCLLLAIESASGLIPASVLPMTLSRSTSLLVAGAGLWVTLAGSILALVAASPFSSWIVKRQSWGNRVAHRKIAATALLLALAIAVGWLRFQPWIASSLLGHDLSLSGQAAPWVGLASLWALILLVAALALAGLSYFEAAGLIAALSGWLISFLAAVTAIAADSLAQLRVEDLGESLSGQSVTFHPALAVWGTYLFGLLIAINGGILVWWQYQTRDEKV
jgi:hypothetical protein